jgi:hypothetical protein
VFEGTAILLGMSKEELRDAVKNNKIDPAKVERARREFRIVSGNMDNSEVKRWEIDVTGIDPKIAEAMAAFLNRVPPETLKSFAAKGQDKPAARTPKGGGKK